MMAEGVDADVWPSIWPIEAEVQQIWMKTVGVDDNRLMHRVIPMMQRGSRLTQSIFQLEYCTCLVVHLHAAMLGGGPSGPNPDVCGSMTSGGTESIIMAIKVPHSLRSRL